MTDAELRSEILASWITLNRRIMSLERDDLERCVKLELKGARRKGVLTRLSARISRLERVARMVQINKQLRG